jgi:hypothetical protein
VWCRDGCGKAYRLGRILVWGDGSVVGTVDLFKENISLGYERPTRRGRSRMQAPKLGGEAIFPNL